MHIFTGEDGVVVVQWLRQWTWAHPAWIQFFLVYPWVIGDDRTGKVFIS